VGLRAQVPPVCRASDRQARQSSGTLSTRQVQPSPGYTGEFSQILVSRKDAEVRENATLEVTTNGS